jgi:hypothetical protein
MVIRICLSTAVLTVALAASLAATAAGASSRSATTSGSFCSNSKKVGVEIANLGKSVENASASRRATALKKELNDIRNASKSLKSSVPKRIKPSLTAALNFVNLVYRTLSGVNWSVTALVQNPQKAKAVEAASETINGKLARLKTYYRKTCKFQI